MPWWIPICALLSSATSLEVRTSQGVIRGLDVQTPYGPVSKFFGVPYAQPPVGPLRFSAPLPLSYSAGVYNATEKGYSCPGVDSALDEAIQLDYGEQDEDCLYLNVWAPANASNLPIVMYVHGGGFVMGSGSYFAFDGTRLAARANIVYVTFNMRLSAFGFIQLPGLTETNVGLLDIVAALDWVRQNGEAFGGNINKMTLWGHSAGAVSIDYLLKSTALGGKVQRVILQGGSAGLGSMFLKSDSLYASQRVASSLGCYWSELNTTELLSCLRAKPWREFLEPMSAGNLLDRIAISPFIDHKLLESDVVQSPNVDSSVKEMLVFSDELEALTLMRVAFKLVFQTTELSTTDWTTAVMVIFKRVLLVPYQDTRAFIYQYIPKKLVEQTEYDDSQEIELQKRVGQMFTDPLFFCSAEMRSATAGDKGVRVYRGDFHFRPNFSFLPSWASMTHGEEFPYVHDTLHLFKPGVKGLTGAMLDGFVNATDTDRKFSDTMMELLKNFFHGR